MTAWYIDALDGRGGLAFASFRSPDGEKSLADADATVFIGAPSFTAEPVLDRTTGLAATRGAFQRGLYVGKEEVPFANLGDVREFVRRVYVGSGGGDMPGPGEGPPTPPEGGEPPEGFPPDEGMGEMDREKGESLAGRFKAAASSFLSLQAEITGDPGEAMAWLQRLRTTPSGGSSLERGICILFRALLERLPKGDVGRAEREWCRGLCSYIMLVERLGVYPSWAKFIRRVRSFLEGRLNSLKLLRDIDRRFLVAVLSEDFPYHWPYEPRLGVGDQDIGDLLSRLPIPMSVAEKMLPNKARQQNASLFSLLEVLLASPQIIEGLPDDAAYLLVVAGAAVAMSGHAPIWLGPPYDRGSAIYRAHIGEIEALSAEWLAKALPPLALPKPIEELIMKAPSLAYKKEA